MQKLLLMSFIFAALIGCNDSPDKNPLPNHSATTKVGDNTASDSQHLIGIEGEHAGAGFGSLAIYAHNERVMTKTTK